MQKLRLQFDKVLQGEFSPSRLNFLFVFQVNCPGCFLYGIPIFNQLFQNFGKEISFLGLSTAFEDFEFNTEENTQLLLTQKELVGETKKALKQYGYEKYPNAIDFPVAMDQIANEGFSIKEAVEFICHLNPNFQVWAKYDQMELRQKVKSYLESLDKISITFTLNQLRGIPSFILFNENYEILKHWFGHKQPEEMENILSSYLERYA